jgi:hypothetical protein
MRGRRQFEKKTTRASDTKQLSVVMYVIHWYDCWYERMNDDEHDKGRCISEHTVTVLQQMQMSMNCQVPQLSSDVCRCWILCAILHIISYFLCNGMVPRLQPSMAISDIFSPSAEFLIFLGVGNSRSRSVMNYTIVNKNWRNNQQWEVHPTLTTRNGANGSTERYGKCDDAMHVITDGTCFCAKTRTSEACMWFMVDDDVMWCV